MTENDALAVLNKDRSERTTEDEQYEQLTNYIALMREKSEEQGQFLSINYLNNTFGLSRFEEECIIICLAFELDRKYGKLFAYLQDDMNYQYPTVDLLLNLILEKEEEKWEARKYFLKGEKLFKYFFMEDTEWDEENDSFLTKRIKIRERIINFVLESELTHVSLSEYSDFYYPYGQLQPILTGEILQKKLINFTDHILQANDGDSRQILFHLKGTTGTGKTLHVKHFCQAINRSLLIVNLREVISQKDLFAKLLREIYREAVLQQSVVCFRDVHLMQENDRSSAIEFEFIEQLKQFSGIIFLFSNPNWQLSFQHLIKHKARIDVEIPIPDATERMKLWEHFGSFYHLHSDVSYWQLANMFEFSPGQIEDSLMNAYHRSVWENSEEQMTLQQVLSACYSQVNHQLETKTMRIKPTYVWEDLILPEEQKETLRDACNQVKYRSVVMDRWGFEKKLSYGKGISMLFSGPPGTGKTMSAEVVANELNLELYKVDLSQVISKYIGETEKNLKVIFDQAKLTNAILFFDETDALFGKRSSVNDSKDKYANIEVAYLLQKMEEYNGITILATNFQENIDEAFLRRISFIIPFPFPEPKQREKIWKNMFPKETPVCAQIDYAFLAEKLPLSGGSIKNIAVSAAFLAAEKAESIGMEHLIKAAIHEMKKSGKILLKNDLEEYFQL